MICVLKKILTHLRKSRRTEIAEGFQPRYLYLQFSQRERFIGVEMGGGLERAPKRGSGRARTSRQELKIVGQRLDVPLPALGMLCFTLLLIIRQ